MQHILSTIQLPTSTYRVQLHAGFTFRDLAAILDYLYELGISTIYASPVTQAIMGSQHGYDVTGPQTINPEIGTEAEWEQITQTLKQRGMTWLQDIVPNHMAYASSNSWLFDVLERGKASEFYSFFDIQDAGERTDKQLMAPFLGNTLTECLQNRELSLDLTDRGLVIRYYENFYPVAIHLYSGICGLVWGSPATLQAAIEELHSAASRPATEWTAFRQQWMVNLHADAPALSFIRQRVQAINEQPLLLAELVRGQHYILTQSSLAASQINYRRFFTVNSLICLRMEDPTVFDAYHTSIDRWYRKGYIQGLRLDHIDGLAAPRSYIDRLRQKFGKDCYIIAEKILGAGESMPEDWDLQGMTGYEFLSIAGEVLTDAEGSRRLLDYYLEQIADVSAYDDLVYQKKHDYLYNNMRGELDNLLRLLLETEPRAIDRDRGRLKTALAILMASFPVYRLYPEATPLPPAQKTILEKAFSFAGEKGPEYRSEFAFLKETLATHLPFFIRLSQFTGPLAAKGIEDTTFYVYHPYIAHNEVGDTPAVPAISVEDFHQKMKDRLASLPHSLNATTTHDTKRSEDNRVRLYWLSVIPGEWIDAVSGWRETNRPLLRAVKGRPSPVPNDEYLIYQALLGGFPEEGTITDNFRERFHGYLTKALREGKTTTSWDHPEQEYEQACHDFVAALLQPDSPFLATFMPFAHRVIRESSVYSLSQLLIKLTAPGIPDIYQGAELLETSFVDPDNRRPVDYHERKDLLKKIKEGEVDAQHPGVAKLFTIYRTLAYRKTHPEVFATGRYIPVSIEGPFLAYIRQQDQHWALIIVPLPRQQASLPETISLSLPADAPIEWTDLFTRQTFRLKNGQLPIKGRERAFPVTLLTGTS